jgi:hypothetical protein
MKTWKMERKEGGGRKLVRVTSLEGATTGFPLNRISRMLGHPRAGRMSLIVLDCRGANKTASVELLRLC